MSCKGQSSKRQLVLIAPTDAMKDTEPRFVNLPHPRTRESGLFLLTNDGKRIHEVQKYEDSPKSWFINNSVNKDGSLCLATPIDPLFLLLVFLEKSKHHFTTIESILDSGDPDREFPYVQQLSQLDGASQLPQVCDVKETDDIKVYRLSNEKTLTWLRKKVSTVSAKLKETPAVHVGSGSRASTFVQNQTAARNDQYVRYAVGLVSEYLLPSWAERLKEAFRSQFDKDDDDDDDDLPPKKKMKSGSGSQECKEDYTKFNTQKTLQVEKSKKLTAAQRALAKVDKTGMKTMSNFFQLKGKKKNA
ncbi:ribonuclease H2 subunit B-like [Oscarella lobularis]|uniref:ribonuclease H2 subunit B-like n=1 Tax=Oscarella lobularis TaxID=121494 RepID=UPI003314123A